MSYPSCEEVLLSGHDKPHEEILNRGQRREQRLKTTNGRKFDTNQCSHSRPFAANKDSTHRFSQTRS
jgi:hypothetical protein